jgi:pimeloyl-ACP methyl ester carboxylesterase
MSVPPRRLGTLARPDCTIAYEVTGSGPAIVFAHGLGGNQMSWYQQVAHFAPTHTCVTFAHRGFHPSTRPPGGPDPKDYADDLAALIAHLGLADVRLVAQSMGGWTSVEYALRQPAGLKGVVLAATTGTINPAGIAAEFQPRLAAWQAASGAALEGFAKAGIHPAAGARMAEEQPAMHLLYKHIDDQNASLDKQALRLGLMHGRTRAPQELAGAHCPVLLLANDEDMVIPPVGLEGVAAANANARFAHIPAAGHSGYFERPAEFNRIVAGFLAEVG